MSTNPDNHDNQLVKIATPIGAIVGLALSLFALGTSISTYPYIALIVALVMAGLASFVVVYFGWGSITGVVLAWLSLIVIVVAGWVFWPTMTVKGIIRDTTSNPVSNVTVTLTDVNNVIRQTTSDPEGNYQFKNIPIGAYRVKAGDTEEDGDAGGFIVWVVRTDLTIAPITTPTATVITRVDTPTPKPIDTLSPTPMPANTSIDPPTSTLSPHPPPTPIFIEAMQDLNLRISPSLRSLIYDSISIGSLIRIITTYKRDEPREWFLVESEDGLRGWTLLNEEPPSNAIPTAAVVEIPPTPTRLPAPVLTDPMTEDRKTLRINDVTLDWEWAVSLEPGWFYSVRVGRDEGASGPPDNPLPCFHFKFSDETEFQGPLEFCEPGRHYWEVVVAARNEGFISTPEITEFDEEEVEEFIEISEVSFREYFDINPISPTSTDTPVPPPPTPTPIPEDTPTSPPPDDDDGGGDGGNGNGGGCKFPPC